MKLRYIIPLLLVAGCQAAITPGGNVVCVPASSSAASCMATLAVATGENAILIFIRNAQPANDTMQITDTCGNSYQDLYPRATTTARIDIFGTLSAHAGSCDITVNRGNTAGGASFMWIARAYGGVSGTGPTNQGTATTTAGVPGNATRTIVTTAAGSYVEAGFNFNQGSNQGINSSAVTGTLVNQGTNVNARLMFMSNHSNSPAAGDSVSNTVSFYANNNTYSDSAAIELLPTASNIRTAQLTDQMHTLVLSSSAPFRYGLPDSQLALDWCTWLMPSGASIYDIVPGTTAQLNGQAGELGLPSWQMTRLCQDGNGDFWANPPFRPGNGVTFTPSATGITISASPPAGGAVNKIAGGTFSLPNENFAANTCVLRPSTGITAAGVQTTDVVMLTRQSSASGWGQGRLKVDAIPFSGSISIEICNADMTNAINPASPLPLNWLVVR